MEEGGCEIFTASEEREGISGEWCFLRNFDIFGGPRRVSSSTDFERILGRGGGERGGMEWTSFINKIRKGDDKIGNVIIVGMNDNSKKLINIEKNEVDTKLEIIQKSM